MLVLARKPQQTIKFPELGITLTLVSSRGGVSKIGIEAPRDVRVVRGELADRKQAEAASDV